MKIKKFRLGVNCGFGRGIRDVLDYGVWSQNSGAIEVTGTAGESKAA
ncbi:MAG: hypothetical protein ABSH39_15835 [Candidatus Acidiferrum sp.]